jgi:hypothetical protein
MLNVDTAPPAERVARVLRYDKHPDDYNMAQTMSADVLKKQLSELVESMADENGVVAVDLLAMEVRGLTHPMVVNPGPHDSIYHMAEVEELDSSLWEGDE